MRKIVLSVQKNIRDLGGLIGYQNKKVKFNRLFRGGFLGKVNEEDIEIINDLHLTDIIDFRSKSEFNTRPDYQFDNVIYHNFPSMKEDVKKKDSKNEDSNLLWFLADHNSGYQHMYDLYPRLLTSEIGISALKDFFNVILQDHKVIYFHCSQGKDRAGLAAFILEIALGVSIDDAKEDYLLSNEAMEIRTKKYVEELKCEPFYTEEYEKSLFDVFSAKLDYLDHAIMEVEKKYQSLEHYIRFILGVDVEKLREMYLE